MSGYKITGSKLKLPEVASYTIERPRIFNLLRDGFKKNFLFILGSSGCGKTTAVANYIKRSGVKRVSYIQLSKQEKDFNVFVVHLAKAIQTSLGINILQEKLLKEQNSNYLMSAYMISRLSRLKKDLYLVFDDFQNIADSGEILGFFEPFFYANLPKVHIVIISQEKPHFKMEKQILLGNWELITGKELYFEKEEVDSFFRQWGIEKYSKTVLRDTEGWPLGIAVAARIIIQEGSFKKKDYKWFFNEFFSHLAREEKKLLLKIAPLKDINLQEVKNYLSKSEILLLGELSHKGLFIYKTPAGFRFHSLFKDFLREELKRDPEKVFLFKKLGNLYRSIDPIESVKFYIEAGGYASAGIVMKENHFFAGAPYGYKTIKYIVDKIPFESLFTVPEVALMKAEVLLRDGKAESAVSIAQHVSKSGTSKRLMFRALRIELEAFLYRGMYENAIPVIKKMKKIVSSVPFSEAIHFYYTAAKVYYFSGNLDKAEEIVNLLMEKMNLVESPLKRARILDLYSIVFLYRQGKFEKARKISETAISMLKSFNLAVDPRYYVNLAMAEMELGEFMRAEEIFREAYKVTDKLFWKERIPDIDVEYGFLWLMRNDLFKAEKVFKKVEKDNPENPFVTASLHMGKSILLRKKRYFSDALKEANMDLEITRGMGTGAFVGESLNNIVKIYIAKGDFKTALNYIKKAKTLLKKGKDFAFLLNLDLMDNISLGKAPFKELEKIKNKGYRGMLSLDMDIIEKYIMQSDNFEIRDRLSIKTLGRFSVNIGDVVLSPKDFRRRGIVTFFKFLVVNYPKPVSMDKIIDILYPKSPADKAKHNVYVAISVLNKLFSLYGVSEAIIRESGMYRINPYSILRIDFVEFEGLIKKGQLREALKLYNGNFLEENLYDDWTMEKREGLISIYVNALLKLAEKSEGVEKEKLLKTVLSKDELNETALFMLLNYYISSGKVKSALDLYRETEKKFKEEYEISVPAKLKKIYKEIST
jgi:ATP/maltotriose-dependent transcriptional regulator MalT